MIKRLELWVLPLIGVLGSWSVAYADCIPGTTCMSSATDVSNAQVTPGVTVKQIGSLATAALPTSGGSVTGSVGISGPFAAQTTFQVGPMVTSSPITTAGSFQNSLTATTPLIVTYPSPITGGVAPTATVTTVAVTGLNTVNQAGSGYAASTNYNVVDGNGVVLGVVQVTVSSGAIATIASVASLNTSYALASGALPQGPFNIVGSGASGGSLSYAVFKAVTVTQGTSGGPYTTTPTFSITASSPQQITAGSGTAGMAQQVLFPASTTIVALSGEKHNGVEIHTGTESHSGAETHSGATTYTALGNYSAGLQGRGAVPTSNFNGWQLGWNASGGGGESDFFNTLGSGSTGGFRWYDYYTSSSAPVMSVDKNGNFTATGNLTTAPGKSVVFTDTSTNKIQYFYQNTNGYLTILGSGGDALGDVAFANIQASKSLSFDTTNSAAVAEANGKINFTYNGSPLLTIDTSGNTVASGALTGTSLTVNGSSIFAGLIGRPAAPSALTAATITAPSSGTAPTGATVITNYFTVVTSCSNPAAGASGNPLQLPAGAAAGTSVEVVIANRSGNQCSVYPPSGGTVEAGTSGQTANVPITIGSGTDFTFHSLSPSSWYE